MQDASPSTGPSLHAHVLMTQPRYSVATTESSMAMSDVVNRIMMTYASVPLASTRQCVGIWLLSILKYCTAVEELSRHLESIQSILTDLLAEGDEFTQVWCAHV
jgi:hypothetical protein